MQGLQYMVIWFEFRLHMRLLAVRLGFKPGTHWPTVGHLKRLGRLGRVWEQICSVCSAAWTVSAPIQLAKSDKVGCWPSEPLDTLIGCVLAVWPFWLVVCWQISACGISVGRAEFCAERTHYCVIGSRRGSMFQCNFSAKQVRREATERSDKDSWLLVWSLDGAWWHLEW